MSDFPSYFEIMLGFIVGVLCLLAGLGGALLYPRPGEVLLYAFLSIAGVVLVVIAYFNLPEKDRMCVKDLLSELGLMKDRFVYCVDCRFYCGTYEVSLGNVNGKPILHKEPRFHEGACMRQGLLMNDGFKQRKCYYFKRRKE